jgi:preprotein translocase subunit SecD
VFPRKRRVPNSPGSAARGTVVLAVTEHAVADRVRTGEFSSIEILERRVAETGIANAAVVREPGGRIAIIAPGLTSLEPLHQMMQILPMRARLTFHLTDTSADACAAAAPPRDFEIMRTLGSKAPLLVEKRVRVAGENVADAVVALDARTRVPSVAFRLDLRGSERLAELTRSNPKRILAIALDHEIIAAPVIAEPIQDGMARISGALDLPRAQELAVLLRAGIFPVPLIKVEEAVVPPSGR